MLHWLYYLILLLVLLCGLALNLFTLPGNWLMLAGVAIYAWVTGGRHVGWVSLLVLLVLAVIAEVLELYAAGAGAKKEGGSRWGSIGALIGGVVGGLLGTFIPVPVVGNLIGILLGTFAGAALAEMLAGKDPGKSTLIGVGAAKGRAIGTLLKLAFGCVILVVSLFVSIPWASQMRPVPTPALPVNLSHR